MAICSVSFLSLLLPPPLFLVLIYPPAIRVSFFHHRVAFSISCALFAARHCPFFFHFLLRNLFSSRRISPLISNRHCASTYDVRLFPRISLLLFANYSRICRWARFYGDDFVRRVFQFCLFRKFCGFYCDKIIQYLSFKAYFKMFLMILRVQYILFIIFFNIYCLVFQTKYYY